MLTNMKTNPVRKPVALSIEWLDHMAAVLRLLAHRHRLKMIELLELRGDAPVFELAAHAGLTPAATSQHLNQMRRVGLVKATRHGKEVRYAIADERALTILGCMRKQQEK
jgi:DNA-binding transcriptional ArsR family regulator